MGSRARNFYPSNARAWGRWIGARYRDADIIWVIGGDRSIENDAHLATWREMAAGVTEGDGGRHLKTFHPGGMQSSSQNFHSDPWLDFNMIQSGHTYHDLNNWDLIHHDLDCYPPKPTLTANPRMRTTR